MVKIGLKSERTEKLKNKQTPQKIKRKARGKKGKKVSICISCFITNTSLGKILPVRFWGHKNFIRYQIFSARWWKNARIINIYPLNLLLHILYPTDILIGACDYFFPFPDWLQLFKIHFQGRESFNQPSSHAPSHSDLHKSNKTLASKNAHLLTCMQHACLATHAS